MRNKQTEEKKEGKLLINSSFSHFTKHILYAKFLNQIKFGEHTLLKAIRCCCAFKAFVD